MYEELKEPIEVTAVFKNGGAIPHSFWWKHRGYKVDRVNLAHQEKHGDNLLFYFSVTAEENIYELSFEPQNLVWTLEKVWLE